PSGTGKTRLVVEAARRAEDRYRDGAWFVPLADIGDPEQVPSAIAAAVGVQEVGGKRPEAVLADPLGPRETLLVIDNFQHLLPAPPVVSELLPAAARLTVAATSQARLRLSGEQLYPVPPLSMLEPGRETGASEAVQLFLDRAM